MAPVDRRGHGRSPHSTSKRSKPWVPSAAKNRSRDDRKCQVRGSARRLARCDHYRHGRALLHEYRAVGAYQLVEASTDPDGGWHTKACNPVQHVAANFCFDLLTGQTPGEEFAVQLMVLYRYIAVSTRLRRL